MFDAEGGSLKIRIFGRTPEEWRALLDKVKRKKRKKRKAKSLEAGGKKQKSTAKGAKRIPEEPPVKTGQSRQNSGEKPETSPDINSAEMDLFKPVKIQMSGQSFADERTDKQLQNPKETQESCQGEKTEGYQEQKQAGRLSKLLARIRGVLSDLPQKVLQVFRRLKRIAGEGVKAAQRIRDAVPRILEKIRRILHQPAVFLQFLEKYEVGEVLGAVKNELFNLLGHYRPRRFVGYLKFGTGDPAQTGELTGALYLLLPTQEYEIVPDFEETQFETETELEGQIRSIHLLVTAYHLFRNKKLKRLIRKLRKKGE